MAFATKNLNCPNKTISKNAGRQKLAKSGHPD
jgi:hypothetical protein